jgi:hypothetical protein
MFESEPECTHDWEFQDDSFDHEFGTEKIHYMQCTICGLTRDVERDDFPDSEPEDESYDFSQLYGID